MTKQILSYGWEIRMTVEVQTPLFSDQRQLLHSAIKTGVKILKMNYRWITLQTECLSIERNSGNLLKVWKKIISLWALRILVHKDKNNGQSIFIDLPDYKHRLTKKGS
jgi:hypothetical protein